MSDDMTGTDPSLETTGTDPSLETTGTDPSLETPVPSSTPESELPDGYIGCNTIMACGVTYRQLDYWTGCGYVTAVGFGTGYRRLWLEDEARIVVAMARLIRFGMSVSSAAQVARRYIAFRMVGATMESDGMAMTLPPELWQLERQD